IGSLRKEGFSLQSETCRANRLFHAASLAETPPPGLGRARQDVGRRRHPGPIGSAVRPRRRSRGVPATLQSGICDCCSPAASGKIPRWRRDAGSPPPSRSAVPHWQGGSPMFGRLLAFVVGISLGFVGAASAADLKPIYKAPPAPPPVVDMWTGFYVGANGGYSWSRWDSSSISPIFPPNFTGFTASPDVNGWVAGIQGGYNWRINNTWLAGVEADAQWTGERAT